jgi:hypothetical protein
MMTVYYEEIKEFWKAGKFFDGINYLGKWVSKGLLTEEDIGSLSKTLPKFREVIEVECEENIKVMFSLYETVKIARNWDYETLCKELRISKKTVEDIKSHRKPKSKAVGLKMLYELFPQMAV